MYNLTYILVTFILILCININFTSCVMTNALHTFFVGRAVV
jgi:hypothetical protein